MMRNSIVFVFAVSVFGSLHAQEKDSINLDLLSAPQSPAANLLGFSDSEIQKPENPTDFMALVQKETSDFTTLPNSIAMDFRIQSMFPAGKHNNYKHFSRLTKENDASKIDFLNNLRQTAVFSFGYKNFDMIEDSMRFGQSFSFGLKFSLFRGNKLDETFVAAYKELKEKEAAIGLAGSKAQQIIKTEPEYIRLDSLYKNAVISGQTELAKNYKVAFDTYRDAYFDAYREKYKDEFESFKAIVEKLEFKTYGFVWDFATGLVFDFPTNNFDYSLIGKVAGWSTFGYEGQKGLSILGLGRVLYSPDLTYTNPLGAIDTSSVGSFDFGGRLLYENPGKSFSLSAEGLYRLSFGGVYDPMYRLTFNAGYEIGKNKKLTFVFGRDFDGAITRDGTVISAINFVMGLGSKK